MPPKRTLAKRTPRSSRTSMTSPGTLRHMIGAPRKTKCGDGGLPERQAAVIRWDAAVKQHLEAVGDEQRQRPLGKARVLEAATRQRHGLEAGALSRATTRSGYDMRERLVEARRNERRVDAPAKVG